MDEIKGMKKILSIMKFLDCTYTDCAVWIIRKEKRNGYTFGLLTLVTKTEGFNNRYLSSHSSGG